MRQPQALMTHAMTTPVGFFSLFFYWHGHHRDLHSFPTRRSSDLRWRRHFRCRQPSTPRRASLNGDAREQSGSRRATRDRKSTRLNSSHVEISYAVFCLKKKKSNKPQTTLYKGHGKISWPVTQMCR